MLWEGQTWLFVGAFGGLLWGLLSRVCGLRRGLAVGLAPLVVVSFGLDLVAPLLFLGPANFEFRTLPMLGGAALPAMLATYFLTRHPKRRTRPRLIAVSALLLAPGFVALLAGLTPRSVRYAKQFHKVDKTAPAVDAFIAAHRRCPDASDLPELPSLETDDLSFSCQDSKFHFCIYAAFDPIGCWDSTLRDWQF